MHFLVASFIYILTKYNVVSYYSHGLYVAMNKRYFGGKD